METTKSTKIRKNCFPINTKTIEQQFREIVREVQTKEIEYKFTDSIFALEELSCLYQDLIRIHEKYIAENILLEKEIYVVFYDFPLNHEK